MTSSTPIGTTLVSIFAFVPQCISYITCIGLSANRPEAAYTFRYLQVMLGLSAASLRQA
jgi:hypothetical protein